MIVEYTEKAVNDPTCEIRTGVASWAEGYTDTKSIKYTWFDVNGKPARGGEIPVEALPQMFEIAIKQGLISISKEV